MPATRAQHALAIVEAAYSLDGTDPEWLTRVLDVARKDLETDCGCYAFTCRVEGNALVMSPTYVERDLDPRFATVVAEVNRTIPGAFFEVIARSAVVCGGFADMTCDQPTLLRHVRAAGTAAGVIDAFSLFAQDGEGYGVSVTSPSTRHVSARPRVLGIWKRIGVHLASAMRLRRRFAEARAVRDAILEPSGAIADAATTIAGDASSLDALTRAVRRIERARGPHERRDPERALELWRGLVAGEWSLVDHWEGGGRRFVAAYRNRPGVRDPRRLTEHERVVLHYVSLGGSNKEIAFTLGVSVASIASAVGELLRKLRCTRRSDLVALAHVGDASRVRVPLGDEEIEVLAVPQRVHESVAAKLSSAEREIAAQVAAGRTNAAIARARGTSPNTIANQLRKMFEKLGVGSRSELVAMLTRA